MEIGYATEKDVNSWMDLVEEVKESFPGLDMDDYKKSLLIGISKKEAILAKIEDKVVGVMAFNLCNKELTFLAVSPSYRRNGIAKKLINYLISLFTTGTKLRVITYRENDSQGDSARNLYQNIGFQLGELVTVFSYPCQEMIYTVK